MSRPPPPRWDQYDNMNREEDDDVADRRLINGSATVGGGRAVRRKKKWREKWTTWSFVACIFIGITILLAIMVGILASVFYETKNASREREDFLLDRGGGHAEAYLFRRGSSKPGTPTDLREEAGLVRFYAEDEGFRVVAEIQNLKPGTSHAFHIFEFTDPTNDELGDIYSPEPVTHGCPGVSIEHRVGDLGNLVANKYGVAMYDAKVRGSSIVDIIGRTIAIHMEQDDCISQPLGRSGKILSSGVIGLGNPKQAEVAPPLDTDAEPTNNIQKEGGAEAETSASRAESETSVRTSRLRTNAGSTPMISGIANAVKSTVSGKREEGEEEGSDNGGPNNSAAGQIPAVGGEAVARESDETKGAPEEEKSNKVAEKSKDDSKGAAENQEEDEEVSPLGTTPVVPQSIDREKLKVLLKEKIQTMMAKEAGSESGGIDKATGGKEESSLAFLPAGADREQVKNILKEKYAQYSSEMRQKRDVRDMVK